MAFDRSNETRADIQVKASVGQSNATRMFNWRFDTELLDGVHVECLESTRLWVVNPCRWWISPGSFKQRVFVVHARGALRHGMHCEITRIDRDRLYTR
jgi:hypothetical protein